MSARVSWVSRTPSANSIIGSSALPSSCMPDISMSGGRQSSRALAKPRAVATISGLNSRSRVRACALVMRAPSEKCSRLLIENSATAAPKCAGPKASSASGSPMLPLLLNITTGTSVRGEVPLTRATAQPIRPDPAISSRPPSSRVSWSRKRKSREARAEYTSTGARTSSATRLKVVRSGRSRRP